MRGSRYPILVEPCLCLRPQGYEPDSSEVESELGWLVLCTCSLFAPITSVTLSVLLSRLNYFAGDVCL